MTSALIQHETKLYCIRYDDFANTLFYQLGLKQFGSMHKLKLDPPQPLRDLLEIAIENEPGLTAAGHDPTQVLKVKIIELRCNMPEFCELNGLYLSIVKIAQARLYERREMLEEYFSLEIDNNAKLAALPLILPGYTPNFDNLPGFLLCMVFKVNWEEEEHCFHDVLDQLADFYTPRHALPVSNHEEEKNQAMDIDNLAALEPNSQHDITKEEAEYDKHQLEHVLFPAFRKYGNFPKGLMNKSMRKLTDLPQLYKVFERC
ncbi:hypothetical protein QFC19_007606 [Naganishia cerealis]|uniref:Uncharacterized protein n=1 Tax=Naganishia cerealis TaxID=610337 RepID=A0ACC2V7U9_9TREE|nr:hypothetical protein QFC19_007606 [Naganishia cerealis]